jgi:MFS superfamily sulfate permease-like transporter
MYIVIPYRVKVFKSFQDRIKEKCSFPIPIHLIVVIVGTALSHVLHFESKFGVDVVGQIPKGYRVIYF